MNLEEIKGNVENTLFQIVKTSETLLGSSLTHIASCQQVSSQFFHKFLHNLSCKTNQQTNIQGWKRNLLCWGNQHDFTLNKIKWLTPRLEVLQNMELNATVTSLNCLFCLSNRPKPINDGVLPLTVMKPTKIASSQIWEAETRLTFLPTRWTTGRLLKCIYSF